MLLALDQGGHSSRALLFDFAGEVVAREAIEVDIERQGDRVEQNAQAVLESLRQVAERVTTPLAASQRKELRVGLACQRSSLVCWRKSTGEPLSPMLSWQDRRAAAEVEALAAEGSHVRLRTGLRLSPHYGASKYHWCWQQLPAIAEASRVGDLCWGPLASYLSSSLCNDPLHKVDVANAQRTQLFDLDSLDWSDELLQLFQLEIDLAREALPQVCDSSGALGEMQFSWGSAPLRLLTGDQSAVVFAEGQPNEDEIRINFGTGAFLQRAYELRPRLPSPLLESVVHRRGDECWWVQEGSVNGAGAALQEFATRVSWSRSQLQQFVQGWRPQTQTPLFLNGVAGLGSPYWDPLFTSRMLPEEAEVSAQGAAIVESILFLTRVNCEALELPVPARRVLVSGGLTRSDNFCQALADLLARPVRRAEEAEATARGVAWWLAGEPSGWSAETAPGTRHFEPHSATALNERYESWCQQMPEL